MLIIAALSCLLFAPVSAYTSPTQPMHAYASEEGGVLREYTLADANYSQGYSFLSAGQEQTDDGLTLECRSGVAGDHARLLQKVRTIGEDELIEKDGSCYVEPSETLDVLGETYRRTLSRVRVTSTSKVVVAFYVPQDYVPEEDYKLQLRFVDITKPDDAPVDQQLVTMKAAQAKKGHRQRISVPTSIKDGSYVLVPGQLSDKGTKEGTMALWQSYYAPERSYTIYYRPIGDAVYANTVVKRIDTIYGSSSSSLREQVKDSIDEHADQVPVENSTLKATLFGAMLSAAFVGGCSLFVYLVHRKHMEDRD